MTRQERYQELVDALGQTIYHESWLGRYWGRAGAIALAKARCFYLIVELGKTERNVLSGLSSTYYSAAGNAWARAKEAKKSGSLMFLLWAWRAWRCLRRAVSLADRLKRSVVKLSELGGDELDVLCSVYRKCRRWEEALACATVGLQRSPSVDSQCLLNLGVAECQEKLGREEAATHAYIQVYELEDQVSSGAKVRLLRALAGRWDRMGYNDRATRARGEARAIAISDGLDDQLAKLDA